jgi:hypothetical protein
LPEPANRLTCPLPRFASEGRRAAIQGLTAEVREGASVFSVRVSELEEENARLREELEAIKRKLGM